VTSTLTRWPQISPQSARVLAGFLAAPDVWRYGHQAVRATGLARGTVYPMLRRFADAGWLEVQYETHDPTVRHRPRIYYRLTADGRVAARTALVGKAAHYRAMTAWAETLSDALA
jgi:DNA-binding PadR family transcriptional regulator